MNADAEPAQANVVGAEGIVTKDIPHNDGSATGSSMDGFARHLHSYVREQIELADKKAGAILALVAIFLGYFHNQQVVRKWPDLVNPGLWKGTKRFFSQSPPTWLDTSATANSAFYDQLPTGLSVVAVISLLISAAYAFVTVAPRLRGSRDGLVFWNAITRYKSAAIYAERVTNSSASELTSAVLLHSYELSRICRRKYRGLIRATWFAIVGAAAALAYLAISVKP